MGFRRRQSDTPRVDLTPMVDVVFLLLIFFMISTTFVETPGLTINLPKSSAQQIKETQEVRIYLQADGSIFLEQQKIEYDALIKKLGTFAETAAETTFLLMADKDVKHGSVVQLMDAAKSAGFKKLAIATEKK